MSIIVEVSEEDVPGILQEVNTAVCDAISCAPAQAFVECEGILPQLSDEGPAFDTIHEMQSCIEDLCRRSVTAMDSLGLGRDNIIINRWRELSKRHLLKSNLSETLEAEINKFNELTKIYDAVEEAAVDLCETLTAKGRDYEKLEKQLHNFRMRNNLPEPR